MEVQSILFSKKLFNTKKVRQWVRKHNFSCKHGIDSKMNKSYHRVRQFDRGASLSDRVASLSDPPSNGKFVTKSIAEGIKFVLVV